MSAVPRVGVLASGGGRSFENLVACRARGELAVEIAFVLSNSPVAPVLERARRHELESVVIDHRSFESPQAFSAAVFDAVDARPVELLVLAGFLRLLVLPSHWMGRVINIHPSLLPKFGGRGFYGERVHAAVLEAREHESGCTVHYVTNDYDRGPILLQRRTLVRSSDDPHSLAARVFEEECIALPEAIRMHFARQPVERA